MGLCISSDGATMIEAQEAVPRATAMVLLPTGELREYPRHTTASRVLEESSTSCVSVEGSGAGGWFLCDADGMGFEGPVAAVGAAEPLLAGQIYFVLPGEARRRGLRREEVAALAVKASAALAGAANAVSGGRRRRGAVTPLLFSPPPEEQREEDETFAAYKAAPVVAKRRPAASRSGRTHRRFASDLTAIPECEMSE